MAATASPIRTPTLEPKIPLTHPGAGFPPMMLSTTNATGHGSAKATTASRIVITTESAAIFR